MDFFISFMLYPSIVYQKKGSIYPDSIPWSIFILNCAWSLGDFPGRSLARIRESYSRRFLLIGNFLRLFFVASTFYLALAPHSGFTDSVAVIVINAWLAAFTNGFFCVAACSSIPCKLEDNEKELGGLVMTVMITSAVGLGSMVSLVGFSRLFPK